MSKVSKSSVATYLQFIPADQTGGPPANFDLRVPAAGGEGPPPREIEVRDARDNEDLGLHTSGFELVHAPSAVTDFYDHEVVLGTYYDECKALAKELTGAHTTFTFDHILREPGGQLSAGGTDGSQQRSGTESFETAA